MGERLVELGFTRNAPVTVLRRAPFGGPLQVRLRDFMLSLRREQADAIRVRPAEGKGDA
jgi:ferrous iron transport protein A